MINRNDEFLIKVAELSWSDWEKKRKQREKERLHRMNIRRALAKQQPKSYKEMQVERLAGRQYTPGQIARGGAIGAGVGTVGHILGEAIQHGRKGVAGAIKNPRALLSSAMKGTLVGSVVPTLKRKADVKAAETGWY